MRYKDQWCDQGDHVALKQGTSTVTCGSCMNALKGTLRSSFFFVAMLLALFPSMIKMYETSHWFREGDPSVYDNAKDWFSNPAIPLQNLFDSSKVLMRVYFFIIPYFLSALFVAFALMIPPAVPSTVNVGKNMQKPRHKVGSFLRVTLTIPSCMVRFGLPKRVSVGEVFCTIVFLTLNIATMAVRVRRSLPRGSRKITFLVDSDEGASKEAIEAYSWQACEVWAKTLGVISILNLGWYLLMPIGRKSVLLEALGLSWERAVKYHRWVGYYSVAIMVAHSLLYVSIWIYGDGHADFDPDGQLLQRNLIPWYCSRNECDDDQARMLRINMYGIVTLVLILTMTVFALPSIRRRRFELFYYVHHLFILVLLFVCLHYKGSIIYVIPGIAIYAVDKLMALYSYRKAAPVKTRLLSKSVLEISFDTKPGVQYKAGDYIFLNVPSVSHLQWHPFSLTSAPSAHGSKVVFHLKAVGSWTEQVIEEAGKLDNGMLQVRLDGFYGVNNGVCDQLQKKDGVILVGGGIGVTPMMSLALELCKTSAIPVTLMWVLRTIDEFSIFSDELATTQLSNENFTAKVWITLTAGEMCPTSSKDASKVEVHKLDSVEREEYVIQHLKSIKAMQIPRDTDTSPSIPVFELDQVSLTGASNALVMAISMLVATVAFSLSATISNMESFAENTQDEVSLMDLSLVCLFVIFWILTVLVSRKILTTVCLSRQKCSHLPGSDTKTEHSVNKAEHKIKKTGHSVGNTGHTIDNTGHNITIASEGADSTQIDKEAVLRSIIEGKIGCRPNIPEEFSSVGCNVVEKSMGMGPAVDIAVMSCGPPKLVESINNHINAPSSCFSSLGDESDHQAIFFSYTEEDWEW